MSIANYCPDEVHVLLAGFIPVTGFFDGTFVEITKEQAPFRSVTSADGVTSRLYTQSGVYNVTLTLMSTSPSNDALTKLWQLDEISQKGKMPILIKDMSGSDLFFSATAWVEGLPSLMKSGTIEGRVWTIKAVEAGINFGGNDGTSGLIEDLSNMAINALPSLRGIF